MTGDGAVHAANQVERDGFDRRTAQAAGDVGEAGAAFVNVDGHGGESVHQGEHVGSAVDGGAAGLYERLGFTLTGEIPDFALKPHGGLTGTLIYWKRIGGAQSRGVPAQIEGNGP